MVNNIVIGFMVNFSFIIILLMIKRYKDDWNCYSSNIIATNNIRNSVLVDK